VAANKVFRFGPVAMSSTLTTNILNCTVSSFSGPVGITLTGLYMIVRHIRIVNKTASAVTFSLWIDATGGNTAGKEFIGTGLSVLANSAYDWYGMVRFDAADFLVGGASAATSMSIEGEGEIGVL
jgi:hypothetical protein